MAQTGQRVDPYRSFNFLVELDGIAQASFTECSGLGSTTEVIENREGGDNVTVRKLPGKTTLLRHLAEVGADDLHRAVGVAAADRRTGNVVRKNGSIVVFDLANSTEVARWNFVRAWPTKWEGSAFNAKGNDIADRDPGAGARRADPGMIASPLVTEVPFELPKGYVDAEGNLHRSGHDAAGDRGRRDLPAEGSAGAELAGLPDHHPAVPGGHPARQPAARSTPASSRACSPRTWRTCRTSTTGSTASPRRC